MASTFITDYLGRGLAANRPTTPPVGAALAFWDSTDSTTVSYWNGSAWVALSAATVTSITAGAGLSGGAITTSGTIALAAIAADNVLANATSGSAIPVATTVSALIDAAIGSTQGDILYRSGAAWTVLAPGTSGQVLQSGGAAANPSWASGSVGSVTSVGSGTGLTGGPITTTGALSLAAIASHDVLSNITSGSAAPIANTLSDTIDAAIGNVQGDILYRNASGWVVLAPGTSGQVLQSGGAASNPSWTAAGGAGTVTSVSAGAGLSGGPITTTGSLVANWNGGTVSALGSGLAITSGSLDVEASIKLRTIPFPIVGVPANAQTMNVTLTQAGTLLANGGTPQGYVGVNATATEKLTVNTIHNGTITTQGTISINTGGTITFPSFTAVAMSAGDTVQIVNQATADATFANACVSLQFQVT